MREEEGIGQRGGEEVCSVLSVALVNSAAVEGATGGGFAGDSSRRIGRRDTGEGAELLVDVFGDPGCVSVSGSEEGRFLAVDHGDGHLASAGIKEKTAGSNSSDEHDGLAPPLARDTSARV